MEARRSGNYGATIWDDDYVQSITTPFSGKEYLKEAEKLKNQVKIIINETTDQTEQLELIDTLQRLYIANHFEDEIRGILEKISGTDDEYMEKDLHVIALKFRVLRQHGYHVPQEVFCSFTDHDGNFKASLEDDVKGLVSLYDASFLAMEGESLLDSAKNFLARHLKERLGRIADPILLEQVKHALEHPLHWRVQKLEAKWFIHAYESRSDANLVLLQLAKLDYNMVQAMYQDEIKNLSRWFKATGLAENLGFARHRLTESFLWALGFVPEPHFGYAREIVTKLVVLITIMDDVYDVYGTLVELEAFTKAIERWDANELDRLPDYMQICFLAIFNFANELAYRFLRDQGLNIIPKLKNLWAELSNAYYLEAKWYHSGYIPSTNEYLNTACISIAVPAIFFHTYYSITNKEELQSLEKYLGVIPLPAMILRLADDLGTSSDEMKRGDVPKAIQCHMHETGCSEEIAREYVKDMIEDVLKRMNKEILMDKGVEYFGANAMNIARISLCVYQYGDGHGVPYGATKKNMLSLIVQPIPMA